MPVIGVVNLKESDHRELALAPYLESLRRAGCEPVLLQWTDDEAAVADYVSRCDGILFTGGDDFDPALYGQPRHEKLGSVTPERDTFELLLFSRTVQSGKPIFAICRGFQLLNVALGGTLYQDIPSLFPSDIAHRPAEQGIAAFSQRLHSVQPAAGSRLAAIAGQQPLQVNSLHHQGIDRLAESLIACAAAPDGLIEAVEQPGHRFLMGVQWHPEHLSAQDPRQQALFSAFAAACAAP